MSIATEVYALLLEKYYPLTDSNGIFYSTPDHGAIGILERREFTHPKFTFSGMAFFWKRRQYIATLWLENTFRGAHGREWVLEVHDYTHALEMEALAEDLQSQFKANVRVNPQPEERRELWSSTELPDS